MTKSTPDSTVLMALLAAFSGRRVLLVGDVMVDRFIYGDVKRISPEAPVPVLNVLRQTSALGGAGNVARNLAALGGMCTFVSVLGDDAAGREATRLLHEMPTVNASTAVSDDRATTVKSRFFSHDGHQLLRADQETIVPLSADDTAVLERAALAEIPTCDAVILSDYGKGVFTGNLASVIIAAAAVAKKPVIVDPKGVDYSRYKGATIITPNRGELAQAVGASITGDAALVEAAQKLRGATEAQAILVTRSGEGMTLVTGNVEHLAAEAHEVADVTGAGDTVVATLALGLAAGADFADAARIANIAAGLVVARHGTAVATVADISAALLRAHMAGFEQKVADRKTAVTQARAWRDQSLKVGFTNGCFDLLHPGHVSLLQQARNACDRLIVGLNSDASVKRLKGEGRPVQTAASRATVIASMANVDLVVVFDEDTPQALIEALRPDVLIKGADYTRAAVVGADFIESYGGRVVLADLVENFSTTATIAVLKRGGTARG